VSLGRFRLWAVLFAEEFSDEPHAPSKTSGSVGLYLFQELSTSGQQLAHTLLFRQGGGRAKPMFPASMSRPLAAILRDALPWLASARWLKPYKAVIYHKSAISVSGMPSTFEKISLPWRPLGLRLLKSWEPTDPTAPRFHRGPP
jgi:hypothetical protein